MIGRTLTQHAVPITFGLKAAQLARRACSTRARTCARCVPGADRRRGGTLGGRRRDRGDSPAVRPPACAALGLDDVPPWHTIRTPFTRYGDALVGATDALRAHRQRRPRSARARDRPSWPSPQPSGRGGSSTMPHKQNPVLSVLVRRAALTAPGLAAQLHLARPSDGRRAAPTAPGTPSGRPWRLLSRRTLVAASQTAELVDGPARRHRSRWQRRAARRLVDQQQPSDADHRPCHSPRLEREPVTPALTLRAAHRRRPPHRASAAGPRALARHLGHDAVDSVRRRGPDRALRRRGLGPARPRPQPRRPGRAVHHGRPRSRACCGSSTTCRSSAATSADPSSTPATRSAAPSVCSCCSTTRAGSRRRDPAAPGARIGDAGRMWAEPHRPGARLGHLRPGGRLGRAVVRPGLPRPLPRRRRRPCCTRSRTPTTRATSGCARRWPVLDVRDRLGEITAPVLAVAGAARRRRSAERC